ncbi:pyrroline-5-carboxylate reductase [Lactococcus hodotermopsidis]|uniref:Pyrroline-5-carboxylate reductase n=1 Tax=Pseudolactococcus hodotermopsidis TaxID=2709157 RepID=A0A6A0BAV6_9LACT|nr:pyrroline-5-carboxylate reductase [Lactococcus hodotermopsidis]GFH42522.1 pyrroline-5-carboxylate reductase [Lactococcus hodotermopsidis]
MTKIGFIGAGKMAQAIIKGLDKSKFSIQISGYDFSESEKVASELEVSAAKNHAELIATAEIIILAVKPYVIPEILAQYKSNKPIVSIAAGVTLANLTEMTSQTQAIVRVMPNINATIQKATTGIVRNNNVSDETFAIVKTIFTSIGSLHEIAEKDFGTFTALAGSSPAYIYMFIDAMSRAGVLHGMPKDASTKIVAETVMASAEMILASDDNPWTLVDNVSSPGGTTVAGVVSLEQNNFVATVIDAITATVDKNKSMMQS